MTTIKSYVDTFQKIADKENVILIICAAQCLRRPLHQQNRREPFTARCVSAALTSDQDDGLAFGIGWRMDHFFYERSTARKARDSEARRESGDSGDSIAGGIAGL